MLPTLVEGDLLELIAYDGQEIGEGDIICFRPFSNSFLVVHRICRIEHNGFRTRGDANPENDKWLVTPSLILGLVVGFTRTGHKYHIRKGFKGTILMQLKQNIRPVLAPVKRIIFSCFHFLDKHQLPVTLLPKRIRPRLVIFNEQMKLMIGKKEIGLYDQRFQKWKVRFLFRLFINTSELPTNTVSSASSPAILSRYRPRP